jgi:hypothetical protein
MSKLADVLANLQAFLEKHKGDKTGGQQFSGPKEFQHKSASEQLGSLSNLGGGTDTKKLDDPGVATPQQKQAYIEKIGHLHQKTGHTPYEEAGSELANAWKSERAGDIGAHLGGAVQNVGAGIGGPVGGVIEKFGELAKKLGESLEKLRKWNDQLYQANIQFAEYSGGMAAVKAEQEVRQIQLEQERGDRRAGAARYQAEGAMELEQKTVPIEDLGARVKGYVTFAADKVVAGLLTPVSKLAEIGNEILDAIEGQKESEFTPFMEQLKDIREGRDKWAELNRPKRFQP